jgi:hypothetical protein
MLATTFVLIWTVTVNITSQGRQENVQVATRSQEFNSEETCLAARKRLVSNEMEFIGNLYSQSVRAICVKK